MKIQKNLKKAQRRLKSKVSKTLKIELNKATPAPACKSFAILTSFTLSKAKELTRSNEKPVFACFKTAMIIYIKTAF